jgi:redox-sensitive bicupin YhaK (pirin superfamily)
LSARAQGDLLHGIQAWIALPIGDEETVPSFAHHPAETLPRFAERGLEGRLIAGSAFGLRAPARTFSPMFYLHFVLAAGASATLPDAAERALYVVSGEVEAGGRAYAAGSLLVYAPGGEAGATARSEAVVIGLGGEPEGERHIEWNFVSSSRERIEAAKADWRAGRMKLPDFDNQDFIPLPS